jgi:hypothetical protein
MLGTRGAVKIHRGDAENAETAQRIPEKISRRFSLRYLCVLCVSAVERLPDLPPAAETCTRRHLLLTPGEHSVYEMADVSDALLTLNAEIIER